MPHSPLPDERSAAVWASIQRLQRSAGRLDERIGDELGLTEVAAKALIAVGEGARTVSGLADVCGRHISTTSRLVDGLVQRGLVDREEDPDDRRAVRLSLTPEGAVAAEQVAEMSLDLLAASLQDLEPRDVEELARLLSALAEGIERRLPPLED